MLLHQAQTLSAIGSTTIVGVVVLDGGKGGKTKRERERARETDGVDGGGKII